MGRRSLRKLLAGLRLAPEERQAACAERCMEALFDPERAPARDLGEHEEAAIEAERRRWDARQGPMVRP
ncbi:MAG: hypothetical protein QOI62_2068 [Solirubrobacteraceae bacterium]|jgi:hypothetical protein|nr:hypothetical protein [Solirubrobacteraceae bacterium]